MIELMKDKLNDVECLIDSGKTVALFDSYDLLRKAVPIDFSTYHSVKENINVLIEEMLFDKYPRLYEVINGYEYGYKDVEEIVFRRNELCVVKLKNGKFLIGSPEIRR